MTIDPAPMCLYCKHLIEPLEGRDVCRAFPEGIPDEIYLEHYDHRKAFPGDKGIRFEAVDKRAQEHVDELYDLMLSGKEA